MPARQPAASTVGRSPVLVAVNGHAADRDAVAWAAAEASARKTRLTVLHVVQSPPQSWDPLLNSQMYSDDSGVHDAAQRTLHEATKLARRVEPELAISTCLRTGATARAIAREGDSAALVVLGRIPHRRPHVPWRRSVTQRVIALTTRPIAVVGFGDPAPAGPSAGRVVVAVSGVHGASAASVLLRHAFEAAQRRGVGVTVLSSDERAITAMVRRHELRYPSVDVRQHARMGPPATQLPAESSSAALLVLGAPRPTEHWTFSQDIEQILDAISAPTTIVRVGSQPRLRGRWRR